MLTGTKHGKRNQGKFVFVVSGCDAAAAGSFLTGVNICSKCDFGLDQFHMNTIIKIEKYSNRYGVFLQLVCRCEARGKAYQLHHVQ